MLNSNRVLDHELREDVRRLLTGVVESDKLEEAIATIDFACATAELEKRVEEREPGFGLRSRREQHERSTQVANCAESLIRALAVQRPLWDTANIDWSAFDTALENIRRSATSEADATKSHGQGLGRRLSWRDTLIATVFYYCPSHASSKTRSAFKDVVERLLSEVFHHEVENLSEVIAGALRRHPHAPFTVQIGQL